MSTSLTSIGQQPNAYQQQPTQSVSNDQTRLTRQQDQKPTETAIQPRESESGQSQNTDTSTEQSFQDQITALLTSNNGTAESVPRGSVLDVVV